jgi:putative ABC transport system permease protein
VSGLFTNSVRMAMRSIIVHKFRSFLTLLGVVIGVLAVIIIVSLGEGVRAFFSSQFAANGNNWLFIMPQAVQQGGQAYGQGRIKPFKIQDADAIREQAPHLNHVLPGASAGVSAKHGNRNMGVQVQGVPWEYFYGPGTKMALGRSFNEGEEKATARVAILGSNARKKLFADFENPLDKIIKLGSDNYIVIGVLEAKGGLDNSDDQVSVPLTTFQSRISGSDDIYYIIGVAPDTKSVELAREEVRQVLRQRRHLLDPSKEDFQIMTLDDAIKIGNRIANWLILVFGFMSLFALLVAGIGIMNMMLVTVTERTREIGLRMALGAGRQAVLMQFLVEAVTLTVIGGIIGIVSGWGIGSLVAMGLSKVVHVTFTATVPVLYATITVAVCCFIGLGFGIWPAYRASQLDPVVAMRKE